MRHASVIVASTRAAAGVWDDVTGPVIHDWLTEREFVVDNPVVVADGEPVGAAFRTALASTPAIIISTGGTGISPTDRTPEELTPHLTVQLPGIIEELRRIGREHTPNALLTRGVAGFAGDTFVVTLPGSPGGVRDGLAVLAPILEHLLGQRSGTAHGSH